MPQVYQLIIEPGEVFSGLTAGDGQPNENIYASSDRTIIDTEIFNSVADLLTSGAVAIGDRLYQHRRRSTGGARCSLCRAR